MHRNNFTPDQLNRLNEINNMKASLELRAAIAADYLLTIEEANKCKESFYYFIQTFWGVTSSEDPIWNWHIRILAEELQQAILKASKKNLDGSGKEREPRGKDIIINIPPGMTKSTIVSVMLNAYAWSIDPTLKIVTGSHNEKLSKKHSMLTRDVIRSKKYQQFFPEVKLKADNDQKTYFSNTLTGERFATSAGSSFTGNHCHIIIVDDGNSTGEGAAERETAKDWFDNLSTRKINKETSLTIIVQQRLHEDDIVGHVLSKRPEGYALYNLPAELSDDVKPDRLKSYYIDGLLDPVKLSHKVLKEQRESLGSYGYASQFLQRPVPLDGGILKRSWFQFMDLEEFNKLHSNAKVDIFVDPAYTASKSNDPTGILITAKVNKQVFVLEALEVWLEFTALIQELKRLASKYFTNRTKGQVHIEPKASGLSIFQQLQQERDLFVSKVDIPKEDKVTRITAMSSNIERGDVTIIRGNWNENFIQQCTIFPLGKHDDMIDCLAMAVKKYSSVGQYAVR